MDKIIAIVGPTGVGKTKLSVLLAKKLNGEIINADAMQVYKNLNIGTAKTTKEEQEGIPHYLFDIKEVNDDYNIYNYQLEARRKIEKIKSRGKTVIIVGGTGLYLKAALYNYKLEEKIKPPVNYNHLTNEEIEKKIKDLQGFCDIHVNNRQRLIRLLEKLENHENIDNSGKNQLLYPTVFIGLTTSRDNLYKIINQRVEKMFADGLLKEVEKYQDKLLEYKSLKTGIGYKEFVPYFSGNSTLLEVKEKIKQNSRHYAKRQYTFFNHQIPVNWFDVDFDNFNNTFTNVYNYIKTK